MVVIANDFKQNGVNKPGWSASEDDTGNVISLGLRHTLAPRAELIAGVSRVDIFDVSSTGFDIELYASEQFAGRCCSYPLCKRGVGGI